eukprot:scaffold2264_cov287-Pinguiococcus_pyrenoidosus.AAC.6
MHTLFNLKREKHQLFLYTNHPSTLICPLLAVLRLVWRHEVPQDVHEKVCGSSGSYVWCGCEPARCSSESLPVAITLPEAPRHVGEHRVVGFVFRDGFRQDAVPLRDYNAIVRVVIAVVFFLRAEKGFHRGDCRPGREQEANDRYVVRLQDRPLLFDRQITRDTLGAPKAGEEVGRQEVSSRSLAVVVHDALAWRRQE